MSRGHFWMYLLNEEGQPVSGASITVQEMGTGYPYAWVYSGETGGVPTQTSPQTTTDTTGYFEFWIGSGADTHAYTGSTKFMVSWAKPGVITAGSVTNVEVIAPSQEVTETDNVDTTKNKMVSNQLAYSWNNRAKVVVTGVPSGSWISSSPYYYYTVVHNLGNPYPIVICYNDTTTKSESICAQYVSSAGNFTTVWRTTNTAAHVTVVG